MYQDQSELVLKEPQINLTRDRRDPEKGLIRPFKGLIRPLKGLIRPFKGLIRRLRAL